ncbi:MAG: GAF domain-containing protein [Halanaerobiaceae bacterium]|nr:GAF domain-containing protein [Halanaerobiaceae bacterium]
MKEKEKLLRQLNRELEALLGEERNMIANLANASALLFNSLPDLNWSGFYLISGDQLIMGPFQGKPACVRIPVGKGVCGTAFRDRKTYVVPDVHEFPGHIACDEASQSEMVIPIMVEGEPVGVMDLDSPIKSRFDEIDQKYLEEFVKILIEKTDFI